jgi:ribosomal-protein-alanine N-acetyltransferase
MGITIENLGKTRRLELRAPQEEDIEKLVALWSDPQVTRHIGGPRDPQVVIDHFQEYGGDPQAYADKEREWWWTVIEGASGEIAGVCSLMVKPVGQETAPDLGYFLLPAFWGQGYATEAMQRVLEFAFEHLDFDSVVAVVDPNNAASIGVAHKLGMRLDFEEQRSDGITRQIYRLRRPSNEPG